MKITITGKTNFHRKPPVKRCRRCRCTQTMACLDIRLGQACCWSHIPLVCSNCLTKLEFTEFQRRLLHAREQARDGHTIPAHLISKNLLLA